MAGMIDTTVSRRLALGLMAAAPAALRAAPVDAEMRMLLQMRGALDDRLVMSYLEGPYYGVVEGRIAPLYGQSAGLFRQYLARPDGGADYLNIELVFVTDLETGELLTEFRNPWTGAVNAVPKNRLGPSRFTITPERRVIAPGPPGISTFHRFRPARVVGDDVWITEESAVFVPPPANFAFNEVLTYHASLRALSVPGVRNVPSSVHFAPVIGWRPWHGMTGHPQEKTSHLMGNCTGRVVTDMADLPPRYLRWLEMYFPDVAADPLKALRGQG
jgi:hypothetical protein